MKRRISSMMMAAIALCFLACAKNEEKNPSSPTVKAVATTESTADAEKEISTINEEYEKAIVRQDVAAYDRLLADDLIFTDQDGIVKTKAEVIKEVRTGDYKFEYGRSEEKKIRVFGNTAVLNGIWVDKGTYKGKEFNDRQRYTTVYVKKNGSWQVISDQVTNIAPPKP